jgi:hypothetical protein
MCPHCGAPALYARGPSGFYWAMLAVVLIVFALIVWFAVAQARIPAIK